MLSILTIPHPILRRRCKPVDSVSFELLVEMWNLMKEAGGVGLSAPQVGINKRFFITGWGEVFVNPLLISGTERVQSIEACLSLPGRTYNVWRYNRIELWNGKQYQGERAIVIQHEIDHLNGKLISDDSV